MKILAKYRVYNHSVIDENTFKNLLIGPDKLPGHSRNGPLHSLHSLENGCKQTININIRSD